MDPALAAGTSASQASFLDGLGERRRATDATGAEPIERLYLRADLTRIPSFEFALRERASRLAAFRHPCFARVRSIDRLNDAASTLAVVSDAVRGVRLATLLTSADRPTIDINAAIHLIRQLVNAVAVLHEHAPDVGHGAIAPERVVITPNARVVVLEYVLGAALEQLRYPRDRYWSELRVAVPPSEALSRFDHRTDVTQIGVTALALIIGRTLDDLEYPTLIGDLLASATALSSRGEEEALPSGLRGWLARALQLDPRGTFDSAVDARDDLERVLSDDDETPFIGVSQAPQAAPMPQVSQPPQVAHVPPAPRPSPVAPQVYEAPAVPDMHVDFGSVMDAVRHPEPSRMPDVARAVETPRPPEPRRAPEPPKVPEARKAPEPPKVQERPRPIAAEAPRPVEPPRPIEAAKPIEAVKPIELAKPIEPPRAFVPAPVDDEIAVRPVVSSELADDSDDSAAVERRSWLPKAGLAAAAVLVLLAGGYGATKLFSSRAPVVATGTVSVTTVPPGAQVLVDNEARGVTPITLTLAPGPHTLQLRGAGEPRTMPVTVNAGQQIAQYVELGKAAATQGKLQVNSQPAGATVLIDGNDRGKAPLLVDSLAPGEHVVILQSEVATVKQTVTIEAGETASLVVPLTATEGAPVSGWVSVKAPVELQIFENRNLVGTTQSDRIMVSAGKHDLELVNDTLGYRVTRTVNVAPGKVAPVAVNWPTGSLAINALPWADVTVDGNAVGQTPIGNLSLPIGPHEIIFRHPDLGEQRQAVTVSLKEPARVSVDMRKKP
ncbi:MAG TPA: PEGA domain-containing protein [Vicinamibacterales bacterium]|nr:PEGA domain-containing protein [Vicinamibacterales bacterium]